MRPKLGNGKKVMTPDDIIVPFLAGWAVVGAISGSWIGTIQSRLAKGVQIRWCKHPVHMGKIKYTTTELDPWYNCDKCHHPLEIKDMIPIYSYLKNKGRCRYCNESYGNETFRLELKGLWQGYFMYHKLRQLRKEVTNE
jgi:prepilin signal peptidase PulO-like enzyme (type II secretory pathway)